MLIFSLLVIFFSVVVFDDARNDDRKSIHEDVLEMPTVYKSTLCYAMERRRCYQR
jgi:hypothetical protein